MDDRGAMPWFMSLVMTLNELRFGSEIERRDADADNDGDGECECDTTAVLGAPPPWPGAEEAAALAAQLEASVPTDGRNSTGLESAEGRARSR